MALASLLSRAVRSAWVGLVVLALGLTGTMVWALSTKRLYRSEAVIVYERGVQTGALSAEESPRQISTRILDMMTARHRLEGLIKSMKLYPVIVEQRNVVEAIEEMRKHISVGGREGYTYRTSFDGDSRETAQKVLDTLVKGVVEEENQRRIKDAEETRKFIDTERKRADEDLKGKEAALATFLSAHPGLAGDSAAPGATTRAKTREQDSAMGGEITQLEMQRAQLEDAIANALRKPGGGVSDLGADPVLVAARARAHSELESAQTNLAEKEAHFTNEHPDVKAAKRRLADAEAAVRRAEAAVVASKASTPGPHLADDGGSVGSLRRALAAVSTQIAALRARNTGTRIDGNGKSTVDIDTEWLRLDRALKEARDRQMQLESKQFQVQLAATLMAEGQGGRLVIADPPFRPLRPVAGGRFKIALVGGAMSLMLALLAVSVLAAFDDRLYGARDIQRVVNDEIVVVVPRLTDKGG
jgi:uncharacterized protein involved in exopolysaccharide biosynthesis